MERIDALRAFIVENFLFGEGNGIRDDTPFLESGVIDSTGMLELVGFLEQRFGIRMEDDEIVPENLNSLIRIDAFLGRKLSGPPPE